MVKGLEAPDVERDSIILDVEPVRVPFYADNSILQRTGVVLRAKRRSQVNVEMWHGKGKGLEFP